MKKKIYMLSLFLLLSFSSISLFAQDSEYREPTAEEQVEDDSIIAENKSSADTSDSVDDAEKDRFQSTGDYILLKYADLGTTNYVTYDAYMNSIKKHLPSVQLNILDVESSKNNLMRTESIGDINLSANLGVVGTQGQQLSLLPLSSTPPSGIGPYSSIGVGSLIPYTGTTWQLSLTNTTMFFTSTDNVAYKPAINLSISQPLLKNFLGMSDRYSINDAKFAVEIAEDTSVISNNSLLVAYQKIYYQWIGLEKSLEGVYKALDNAKKFETRTRSRYYSGLIDNDSYQLSRAQTFQYTDMLTQYEENIISLINTLRFFITNDGVLRPDHEQWNVDLEKAMAKKPEFVPFHTSSYGQVANKNGERIANSIAIKKNLTLPDLSLVAGVNLGADDYNSGYFDSISKMTNLDYYVGFKFSYPIGDKSSRANLRDAEIELEKFNMQYRNMILDYNSKMRDVILRYDAIMSMIETKKNRIASLESALRTQTTKYNQGRISITDLIETENSILTETLNMNDLEFQLINNYFDYKELFEVTHFL